MSINSVDSVDPILNLIDQRVKPKKNETLDQSYGLVDMYLNDCLYKINLCENGTTIVFNLSLNFNRMVGNSGKTVLFSSGGDSPYSHGGFYLHQINKRGEKYVEFGYALYANLYSTKVIAHFIVSMRKIV